MWCRTCYLFIETQQHIFECCEIRKKCDYVNFGGVSYKMIFGTLKDQEMFTKVYHMMFQARDELLNGSWSSPSTKDLCTCSDAWMQWIVHYVDVLFIRIIIIIFLLNHSYNQCTAADFIGVKVGIFLSFLNSTKFQNQSKSLLEYQHLHHTFSLESVTCI